MNRYPVADATDLAEDGDSLIAEIEGQEIGVYRIDGETHAIANFCPHQAGPLCGGPVTGRMVVGEDGWSWRYDQEGEIVTCPWHGWKFEIPSGLNIKNEEYAVPTYEVTVEDGTVYVER